MITYIARYSDKIKEGIRGLYPELRNNAAKEELLFVRPESSPVIPKVSVRLLYCEDGIAGLFEVEDHYMVCNTDDPMGPVWQDSCVEFFFKPSGLKGYFNFEFNCIGIVYASYVVNPERTPDGFKEFKKFSASDCGLILTDSSIRDKFDGEIEGPAEWSLAFYIPFNLLGNYSEKEIEIRQGWRCNFYKCADASSHPHWLSWAPVEELNFHAPQSFGKLEFKNKEGI